MIKNFAIAGFALATLSLSCKTSKVVQMDALNNKEVINLKTGESYKLKVRENVSTGHAWYTTTTENCNVEITDSYKRDDMPDNMVGVGGDKTYTITAKNNGECSVTFEHKSPGGGSVETKTIIFKVK